MQPIPAGDVTTAKVRRRSLSLPLRINLISLVFAALVTTVLTGLGGYYLHQQQADNARTQAHLAAEELASRAERLQALGLELEDFVGFDEQCEAVVRNDRLLRSAAVYGKDGRRFAASSLGGSAGSGAWRDARGERTQRVDLEGGTVLVRPILRDRADVQGHAVVQIDGDAVLSATLSRVGWLAVCALSLFVVGLGLQQLVFWRMIGSPLAALVRTADNLRPDTMTEAMAAPAVRGDDDIGRLYGAFARLMQRVAEARQQLIDQNEHLEAMVRERTRQLERANAELANDILRRQELEDELRRIVNTDVLTGLASRAFMLPYAERRLQHALRHDSILGVALLDFDGFKSINDTYGHAAGDAVLRVMAARLESVCRKSDVLGRLGGDEFLLVFEGFERPDQVPLMATRLAAQFDEPIEFQGRRLHVGVSIGLALHPTDGKTVAGLLAAADAAMYAVKQRGGGFLQAGDLRAATVLAG